MTKAIRVTMTTAAINPASVELLILLGSWSSNCSHLLPLKSSLHLK